PTQITLSGRDQNGQNNPVYRIQNQYLYSSPGYQNLVNQNILTAIASTTYTDLTQDTRSMIETMTYPSYGSTILLPVSKTTVDSGYTIATTNSGAIQKTQLSQTRTETYQYDSSGNIVQKTINGLPIQYTYQNNIYLNRVVYPDTGLSTQIDYDLATGLPISQTKFGRTTQFAYLPDGRISQRIQNSGTPQEIRENTSYDVALRKKIVTDSRGQSVETIFGINGQPQSQTSIPAGSGMTTLMSWSYGPENDLLGTTITKTDSMGRTSSRTMRYQYDVAGRLIKTTYPDDSYSTCTYGDTTIFIPNNLYSDSSFGFFTADVTPLTVHTTTVYDRNGIPTSIRVFGLQNRFRDVAGPNGILRRTLADGSGFPISEQDSDGVTT
ncbi:hypothetical protein EB093_09825, partial [bacterium]|nr:hypothetical protein [bacterium]